MKVRTLHVIYNSGLVDVLHIRSEKDIGPSLGGNAVSIEDVYGNLRLINWNAIRSLLLEPEGLTAISVPERAEKSYPKMKPGHKEPIPCVNP